MKSFFSAAALALLFGGGCFFGSYRDITQYDLTIHPADGPTAGKRFAAQEFQNRSGAGTRFQYREGGGRIVTDPDRKWVLPPEELIPRALNAAFPAAPAGAPVCRVRGVVEYFEASRPTGKFIFSGSYELLDDGKERREKNFRIEVPLPADSPEALVEAASRAVAELARQIRAADAGER